MKILDSEVFKENENDRENAKLNFISTEEYKEHKEFIAIIQAEMKRDWIEIAERRKRLDAMSDECDETYNEIRDQIHKESGRENI